MLAAPSVKSAQAAVEDAEERQPEQSAPIPDISRLQPGEIVPVVADTLEEMVLDSEKDVLLLVCSRKTRKPHWLQRSLVSQQTALIALLSLQFSSKSLRLLRTSARCVLGASPTTTTTKSEQPSAPLALTWNLNQGLLAG